MKIKNINKTIFKNGDTADIIKVVMMAYDIENDPQIEVLASQLQGETDYDTCKNIWQYLIDNVNYKADTGKQEIKSPARLLNDKVGDCKSYSLFTAVILRYLGIDHVFRFVSYDNRKEATHVYVVAKINYKFQTINCIIDAVATVQAGYDFNTEIKYNYHCDMADKGTKIAYLAGLPGLSKFRKSKRNYRVGATVPDFSPERYKVWIGDENQKNITPGKQYLYARFDLMLEYLNIAKTPKQQAYYFNQLDIIASLLFSYNYCNGVCKEIKRMAYIISGMVTEGLFSSSETNEDVRADKLDIILDELVYRYTNDIRPTQYDAATFNMFIEEVYNCNLIPTTVNGIGASSYQIADEIKKAGIYYIYTFIPEAEQSNHPAIVADKRDKQNQTFNWMKTVNTYQTPSAMQLSIRAGIIARTGMDPETYIAALKNGKQPDVAIGDPVTLTTIALVIGIITGLIGIIKFLFPADTTPKPSDAVIKAGAFDPTKDYSKSSTSSSASLANIALPLALGGALLIGLFTRKKNQ